MRVLFSCQSLGIIISCRLVVVTRYLYTSNLHIQWNISSSSSSIYITIYSDNSSHHFDHPIIPPSNHAVIAIINLCHETPSKTPHHTHPSLQTLPPLAPPSRKYAALISLPLLPPPTIIPSLTIPTSLISPSPSRPQSSRSPWLSTLRTLFGRVSAPSSTSGRSAYDTVPVRGENTAVSVLTRK